MPVLRLSAPAPTDATDLLAFEVQNRAFFEDHINSRPSGYYSIEGVQSAIAVAEEEARAGVGFQYLVRDERNAIVARANLSHVRRAHFFSAELGYRVAEAASGKGVATEAVRQVTALAFSEHGLLRIEARSRPENLGSVRVLERNGFQQFGRARQGFLLRGVWHDLLYFECHAEKSRM